MAEAHGMRRIALEDFGRGEAVLSVRMPYAEFVQRFGEKHYAHPPGWDAPGPVELWAFELPWGLRMVLEYNLHLGTFGIILGAMEADAVLDYLALRDHTHHVRRELIDWLVREHPVYAEGLGKFSLYRQDDNGTPR